MTPGWHQDTAPRTPGTCIASVEGLSLWCKRGLKTTRYYLRDRNRPGMVRSVSARAAEQLEGTWA